MPPRKRKSGTENATETESESSSSKSSARGGMKNQNPTEPQPSSSKENVSSRPPLANIHLNVVNNLNLYPSHANRNKLYRSCEAILSLRLKDFNELQKLGAFCNRVTALTWHRSRLFFIVGLKTGDMHLYHKSDNTFSSSHMWIGKGPGLSILDINFPEHMEDRMVTASIDGTVKIWDLGHCSSTPLKTVFNTGTIQRWFCSVSSSRTTGLTVVGDTHGKLFLLDKDMKEISNHCIHKGKINTASISTVDGNTLVTASLDRSVKLFDLRLMKQSICERVHKTGVGAAYFSNTSSCRLLTTDHYDKINIFSGVHWDLEKVIEHPHRQFMYLSPIQAVWHPQCDLIVVGRYPDPKKPEFQTLSTVDIYNTQGELKCQLLPSRKGIVTLTSFNSSGEYLLSAQGPAVTIWNANDPQRGYKRFPFVPPDEFGPDDNFQPPGNDGPGDAPPKKMKKSKNTKAFRSV